MCVAARSAATVGICMPCNAHEDEEEVVEDDVTSVVEDSFYFIARVEL